MALFGKSAKAIGLDIGSESARAVELTGGRGQAKLTKIGSVKLPRGAVVDGEVSNPAEVARALRQLWKESGFTNKKVTVGVSNPKVIARQVELPYMEADALQGAIRFQAQEFIPIAPQNLILDYHVVGETVGDDGQKMLRVLLVAAHRDMIENFIAAVQQAGLTPWIVYLSSLALVRSMTTYDEPGPEDQAVASTVIVNVGAGLSNVVIVHEGNARFARVMTFGGDDLTRAVAERLQLEDSEAEQLKIAYGLPDAELTEDVGEQGQVVRDLLQKEAYKFVDEVRRSIEYYFSQDISNLSIDKVLLTGGAAQLRNLSEFIGQALGVEVEIGDPFVSVTVPERSRKKMSNGASPLSLAPAIGLGLRGLQG